MTRIPIWFMNYDDGYEDDDEDDEYDYEYGYDYIYYNPLEVCEEENPYSYFYDTYIDNNLISKMENKFNKVGKKK